MKHAHPFKARLFCSLLMVLLAFIGLILTDILSDGAWNYWRVLVPIFACISIWLSWYLRKANVLLHTKTIWHEVLHWVALIGCVYLVSLFVNMGLIGRFEAALQVLTLLALSVFMLGIYIEATFLIIGVLLAVFVLGAAYLAQYLYTIMLPVTIIGAALIVYFWHKHSKKHQRDLKAKKDDEISKKETFKS